MLSQARFTEELGVLHQKVLQAEGLRKSQGSFYTPSDIVEGLLDISLMPILNRLAGDARAIANVRVLDPACGSGNFLAGAARRITSSLVSAGVTFNEAVYTAYRHCIIGVDIDGSAVRLARQALALETDGALAEEDLESTIIIADALTLDFDDAPPQLFASEDAQTWSSLLRSWGCAGGVDLVIGNPPFLSQLSKSTSRSKIDHKGNQLRFGQSVARLTDTSAVFLMLGIRISRLNGTVCMIQPLSFLAARDASGVRKSLTTSGALTHVWIATGRPFDAEVDVCAVVSELGIKQEHVSLHVGPKFMEHSSIELGQEDGETWSRFIARMAGVPQRSLVTRGSVGEVATATSDFRDFYYGIAPHVVDKQVDDSGWPRVLTVGLIDIAVIRWGHQSTRLNKQRFVRPHLNMSTLEPSVRHRADELLVPKVVVATQTRTLEAAVDEEGRYVPSVPVVTLIPHSVDLWHLAAAVNAPPVLLVALDRHSGSGLGADALRLSARDCLELPLPGDASAWAEAARLMKSVSRLSDDAERVARLREYARAACTAYGCLDDQALIDWWWDRLTRGTRDSQTRLRTT